DRARDKAAEHAGNFIFNRERQVEYLYQYLKREPVIIAPYDTELFGHWWFEGPMFLDFLFRKIHYDQHSVKCITPSEFIAKFPRIQVVTPSMSSWGWKGYSEMWLESSNDWIYRHLHSASWKMTELAQGYTNASGIIRRALNQALRELLLAQASDWAFIMKTGTHVSYAIKRTKEHLLRFLRLYEEIKSQRIDEGWLSWIEHLDNVFPDIDYKVHS
ncbi:MAG: 1,4-alpha-glucan branching protein domain-containing protein, partial [Candidatus Omnitrophota bacterium]